MLLYFQPIPQDDESMRALKDVENTINKQEKKLSDITYELDGIHRVCLVFFFFYFSAKKQNRSSVLVFFSILLVVKNKPLKNASHICGR